MAVDGSIRIDTQIDSTNATKGISKIGASIKKLGVAVGAAFAVKQLVNFGKQAIQVASDLQEVQNVVDVAFGDMSYKAEAFAKTALESFGMSELTAKQTSSTFMAMSKSMGLSSDAASDMAISVAGLVGDVASFYNISQDLAAIKLKSIWTGETETLKDLGVVMTEANLKAYALELGITKSLDSMTQAEKVQLRYKYVMEQLSIAQGDFARTSDSWANRTRVLQEQFKSLLGILGKLLIQGLNPVLEVVSKIVDRMIVFAQALSEVFLVSEATDDVSASAESATAAEQELAEAITETSEAIDGGLASFDELNTLQDGLGDAEIDFGLDLGTDDSAITIGEGSDVSPDVKNAVQTIKEQVLPILDSLKNLARSIGDVLISVWNNAIKPVLPVITETIIPALTDLYNAISELIEYLMPYIDIIASAVGDALGSIIEALGGVIDFITGVFSGDLDTALGGIESAFGGLFDAVSSLFEGGLNALSNLLSEWGIDVDFQYLMDGFRDSIEGFKSALGGLMDFIKGVFTGDWETAWNGIKDFFSGIWDGIKGIFVGMWETFDNMLEESGFKDKWNSFWNNVGDVFKNVWNSIKNFFQNIWNSIIDVGKTAINALASAFETGLNGIIWFINKITSGLSKAWTWAGVPAIPSIPSVSIPRLANGAVIQPNNEFLAILGDQRSGVNIETPLSTMVEAFKQALSEGSGSGQSGTPTRVSLVLDGRVLGEVMLPYSTAAQRNRGTSFVTVEAR